MAQLVEARPVEKGTRDLDATTRTSHEGWVAGALIVLMLLSVTASVGMANWAEGVSLTTYTAIAGVLFGALVARLRLSGWLAHPLMVLEGAFVTAFVSSSIVPPVWATWNEKMILMELRLGKWASAVLSGGIGTDTLLFVMLLCALAWLLGYVAAWSVFREHETWGAILPAGAALLINLFYAPPQSGLFLMVFLLSAMLLLVRTTLLKRQETWQRLSIRYANDIGFDFLTYGIVFSGIVILASWVVPASAPGPQWFDGITNTVRGPWQDASDSIARMFSTVRSVNNGGPATMFGGSLSMGGPIHLGNRPVLDIQASQGRYWRAVVFDKYTGIGWVNTASDSTSFPANDTRMQIPPVALSRVLTQTVQVLLPGSNLVIAASDPFRVSAAIDVRYSAIQLAPNETFFDIAQLRFQTPPRQSDVYTVQSVISGADETALRDAPTEYPQYVLDRYLQLPSTVPARVHDLAVQITAGQTNNYDKARAIEEYLRAHIKYDESVSAPPTDRDGVDYTLFDRPAGYCNYYASAMAVLAREVGIPARVASGYATGKEDNGVFHVTEGDAHTWPELYFGTLGWIQFEPTASKPEIVRPVKQASEPAPTVDPAEEEFLRRSRINPRNFDHENPVDLPPPPDRFAIPWPSGPAGIAATAASSLLVLGLLAVGMVQVMWNRRMRTLSPGARAWEEMYRLAQWVGFQDRAQATPMERADELARALPDARAPISDVADMYVRERYGAQALTNDEAQRAIVETKFLHRRILRGAVENLWQRGPVRVVAAIQHQVERFKQHQLDEQ